MSYNGNLAYPNAKLGHELLAGLFTKEYPEISFVSSHPGWVKTADGNASSGDSKNCLIQYKQHGEALRCFLFRQKASMKAYRRNFLHRWYLTKNIDEDVNDMMENLGQVTGV